MRYKNKFCYTIAFSILVYIKYKWLNTLIHSERSFMAKIFENGILSTHDVIEERA